jgi:GNAT superfamily N-acetyltransferase
MTPAPADTLLVQRISELSAAQVAAVVRIYDQAFPPHLQVPFTELAAAGPADDLLVGMADGSPVAFAAVKLLADAHWVFLRYFGVARSLRGQGVGLRFWQQVVPAVGRLGWPDRIAFECEHPDHAPDAEERQVCTGRIEFWQRCGCFLLSVADYVMPDISGIAEPEPMLLMAWDRSAGGRLTAAETRDLVLALYQRRYRLAADDPLIRRALASIGG